MQRKKIAFIITKLELGGAQKSVLYTAAHISPSSFETYLLCGPGGYFDAQAKKNLKNISFIKNLRRAVNPYYDCLALFEIRKTLRQIKPDIIHTNSSKAGILGRAAAIFLKNTKVIHTVHGFGFNDRQNFLTRGFYITLERLLARATDVLIFVSDEDLNTALKLKIAPPEKCKLIRAGVELKTKKDFKNFDRTAKLKSLGLKPESKIILSVANLKPQKNPLDMVEAARLVTAAAPDAVFLYTGSGPLEDQTRALINKYNLQNNFKLLGAREDIYELLACADIFTLTSLWEGLPMSVIEALSMGLPCVCYDAGGIKEVIGNGQNGFIIKRGNYQELAGHIINILRGGFHFKTADLKEFDIKEMVKKQEELYGTIC